MDRGIDPIASTAGPRPAIFIDSRMLGVEKVRACFCQHIAQCEVRGCESEDDGKVKGRSCFMLQKD